jgi:hypothetical protein
MPNSRDCLFDDEDGDEGVFTCSCCRQQQRERPAHADPQWGDYCDDCYNTAMES